MKPKTATGEFQLAIEAGPARYVLRLYIAGSSDRSTRAIRNAKEICDAHLPGGYDLDVIDLLKQPARSKDDHILAVPTLVKRHPLPVRRIIGDLSERDDVLAGLDLERNPSR